MWRDVFFTMVQLLVAPSKIWKELARETRSENEFHFRFLYPIFGVIALAAFIGGLWFTRDGNVERALKSCIISVVAVFGGYIIAAYVLNELALYYGKEKDMPGYRQFVGYASTMIYLLYIVISFLPYFFILWFLSLYTVYLVAMGAPVFLKIAPKYQTRFTVAASAVIILAPILIQTLFSLLIH